MISFFLAFCLSSKLDLPILKRIADDDLWPPLRIFIYPINNFPNRLYRKTQQERFFLEDNLPDLIKESAVFRNDPNDADLYLVPLPISSLNISEFSEVLSILSEIGPYYDEYHGANHIFLHSKFPTNDTAINIDNFLLHQGHILTSCFNIEGPSVKTWVYAKNLLLSLKPVRFYSPPPARPKQTKSLPPMHKAPQSSSVCASFSCCGCPGAK